MTGEGSKQAMDARVADAADAAHFTHYKYPFLISDVVDLQMHRGARLMHVAQQAMAKGDLQLWALVDKREPLVTRRLRVYGTGNPCPGQPGVFVGTVLFNGGAFVWHVYDAGEVR